MNKPHLQAQLMKPFRLYKIFFSVLLLSFTSCPAQAGYFDTLNSISNKADCQFVARKIYFEKFIYPNYAQALAASTELLAIAAKKNDHILEAYANLIMGRHYSGSAFWKEGKALSYLNKAMKLIPSGDAKDIEAEIYCQMGWCYYWGKKYSFAFEYFLKANSIIKKIGYNNYFFVHKHLYDLGFMYYDFADYKKAKEFIAESIKYPVEIKRYMIDAYNTLGLVYRELKENDSAIVYLKKTIELAEESKDSAWIGIATGNLAHIYYRQEKYDLAIPMFLTDYTISAQHKDWNEVSIVLTKLGTYYVNQHQMELAADALQKLDSVIAQVDKLSAHWQYYIFKAKFYAAKNNFTDAYRYLDSSTVYHDQLLQRNDAKMITQVEQKAEVAKHLADIELLHSERNKQVLLRNTIIICAILLLIIAIQFIHRLRIRQKRNAEVLNAAKTQLNHYIDSIRDKNQLIDNFKQEIKHLNSLPNSAVQIEKDAMLHQLQNSTILTDDDWDEFRHLFEKVHKGFFAKLKLDYPNLTNSEMRLMALTKLNLSKKEMAEMLGISPDSIKKTRQRVLKKLNLSEEETLDELVLKM